MTRECRKKQGKYIVNTCLEYLKTTNTPPHVLVFILKSFHLYGTLFHPFVTVFAPWWLASTAVCILWIIGCAFIYFDGCLLSKLEYELEENKEKFINVIDPIFYLLGIDIDKSTQWWVTVITIWTYAIIAPCILLYRFK
jgi:hypothetical protein